MLRRHRVSLLKCMYITFILFIIYITFDDDLNNLTTSTAEVPTT